MMLLIQLDETVIRTAKPCAGAPRS